MGRGGFPPGLQRSVRVGVKNVREITMPYTRKKVSLVLRAAVMTRDGGVCRYCGQPATVVDHLFPVCRGGENSLENLVASCGPCNAKASGLYFATFEARKAFILDPARETPDVMTMRAAARNATNNHAWRRTPLNPKKPGRRRT